MYEHEYYYRYDYEGPDDSWAAITVSKRRNRVIGCSFSHVTLFTVLYVYT